MQYITKYLNTRIPFKKYGFTMDGLDCIGMVHLVAKDNNIKIPIINFQYFNNKELSSIFIDQMESDHWVETKRGKNVCVTFKICGRVCHIGWMIDNDKFIHILEDSEVSIESLKSPTWNKRVYKFLMYKENI